jgi:Kdo2-lipid IVA lauroyltransferase/acyltransferase
MTRERRFALEQRAAALITPLAARLPRRAALALGRGLGRLWGDLDRRHLAIAADNLRRAFPHWDEARVMLTARAVYAYLGELLLDLLWTSRHSREEILSRVEVVGGEHVREAIAAGRGVLYVTGHFGNWELNAVAHAWLFGPVSVVARALDNPALDRRLCAARSRSGNQVIYKERALSRVMKALRDGQGVAILVDQNVQEADGIFVDFFGRPAASTTVAAALALKTGCAVIPGCAVPLGGGRYRLRYDPPLRFNPTGDRDADIAGLTQQIASHLEGWIRERPELWLWLHRRWKTQPAAAPGSGGAP